MVRFQLFDIGRRFFYRLVAGLFDDSMQSRIDIFGHSLGITAHVEVSAVLQPSPQISCVFQHSMLNVDFLRLIPRERRTESSENAVLFTADQFVLIKKIGAFFLIAEKYPI